MPKYSEQKIQNILARCNAAPIEQLLELCLDPDSGITLDMLRAVNYNKIEMLERQYYARAEEILWGRSQNSIEALTSFIEKCQRGIFSQKYLSDAINKRKELAAAIEEEEWNNISSQGNLNLFLDFINKCKNGFYSEVHLQDAIKKAEEIDWLTVKQTRDIGVLNGFIQKCNTGFYSQRFVGEAEKLLDEWANATIVEDWNKLVVIVDPDIKLNKLNTFIQTYATNPSKIAQEYMVKANELMQQIADEKQARIDWIDAKNINSILGYVSFLSAHPYSSYREEAEELIKSMKGELLSDMKRFPFKYGREMMYEYISSNALTMQDLVDDSDVLTDRGYSHIKRYPRLTDEQRQLPVSRLENPHSEEGSTDIYFFGVSGSGKTCVLSGLMSLTGQLGFKFDPKGPGGGGNYAMELRNYARSSMLPPATDQSYIQDIDAQIDDEEGHLHKISFIEMSGEKTALFAAMDNPSSTDDLGPGAAGLLSNNNNKVLFFVIDPTNEKNVEMGMGSQQWVLQSDVLACISALLSKNPTLLKKVVAIHVILTKSDTLGDYVDKNTIMERLTEQGYLAVFSDIKEICQRYEINKQTGFEVGLYPFHVGKFMPGDVYTFDPTDSLKILRVIQQNTVAIRKRGFLDTLHDWFNS